MNLETLFGSEVFNETVMRERLPENVFQQLQTAIETGSHISMETADIVAAAMKDWAVEHGATHYTHWFQPLTGVTAEKHDSFLTAPVNGKSVLQLSGKQLIKGEPDASSFPTGGLRATHYARGYTAWDMTSPAFLKESATGPVLCIPTSFISYTGEALDQKTPLLRSMEAINTQSLRILRLFGNTEASRVYAYVGPEQEYFLVDREKYLKRRDLIYCGRTLFGAPAPKGQELDDQYYGVIRERIGAFMKDLNEALWKLGIPATTQHNEAAPAQHEMAPIYEVANVAIDHNQLTMEIMKRVAAKHGMVCLLHEKPFAGVNGSGKHDNWSIGTDTGLNLLAPGETPNENLQFLLVLACILKAIDTHAELLRQSAANVGNDQRLGANEAPPAIVSVFLGNQLDDVVSQIVSGGTAATCLEKSTLDTGVSTLPLLDKDATDRNRTSPFAFTGNKFEFRMLGSSDSVASPNTVLNTIVADAFCDAADELEKAENFESACKELICRYMTEHQRIIFNGNGYSEEWVREAERRGLPNLKTMVDSIPALTAESSVKLFERFGIFTRKELESRAEVLYETYAKVTNIEASTMVHMAGKHFIPAAIEYATRLAQSVNEVTAACPAADVAAQRELLCACSTQLNLARAAQKRLDSELKAANAIESADKIALAFRDNVVPAMAELRCAVDALELIVDKDIWPVPTYGDLMFEI